MRNAELLMNYARINVVGCPGSGKSTLAKELSRVLNIKVYDLDNYLYNSKCDRLDNETTATQVDKILLNEKYIIDGTYFTTFNQRLKVVNVVILVESRTIVHTFRFVWRLIRKKKLNCGERMTLKTLELLFTFNSKVKPLLINNCLQSNTTLLIYSEKHFKKF